MQIRRKICDYNRLFSMHIFSSCLKAIPPYAIRLRHDITTVSSLRGAVLPGDCISLTVCEACISDIHRCARRYVRIGSSHCIATAFACIYKGRP
jgi:hypothetical protein